MDWYSLFLNLQEYGYISMGLFSLILLAILLFCFLRKSFKKTEKPSSFTLFSIRIFPKTEEELKQSGKQEKDWIGLMEDFYHGLISSDFFGDLPRVVLEIARVKGEIGFYVSVPKGFEDFIKKKVYKLFPEAQMEKVDHYNIFSEKEEVVCGYLKAKKSSFLPVKTYNSMKNDPLSAIVEALVRLEKDEEAVIQIVLKNAPEKWQARADMIVEEVGRGKSFDSALRKTGLFGFFNRQGGGSPEIDENLLQALKEKTGKRNLEANIRIVVSIRGKKRSRKVFSKIAKCFKQFSSSFNGFTVRETKGLKDFLYHYGFRLFNSGEAVVLNTEELAGIFHFSVPGLKDFGTIKSREALLPKGLFSKGVLLGYNQYRKERTEVRMSKEERSGNFLVLGKWGTGKSSFLSSLIEQDILNGEGVAVLDAQGGLIEDILGKIPDERIEEVMVFDPSSPKRAIGLNPLESSSRRRRRLVADDFSGPERHEALIRNALLLLMGASYTLTELPGIFSDARFRERLVSRCKNPLVKEFWRKQKTESFEEISDKLDFLAADEILRPVLGQKKSAFNFNNIIRKKKIFLADLSREKIGERNSFLLGKIILNQINVAVSSIKIPDFSLYLDEVDAGFLPVSKLRFAMVRQSLNRKNLLSEADIVACFRVGMKDAEFLKKEFEPVFSMQDLISAENFNFYLKPKAGSGAFNVKAYPFSPGDKERAWEIKEYCALTYGRDKELIEEEISGRSIVLGDKLQYNI
ncbi:MAG: hypothetical protein WC410_03320 [Candidatus Paceibacterota bacterium]|jgi:hypothetical protein|nr:hypothetical protein [Candidatus Paceibacterota bacterium]